MNACAASFPPSTDRDPARLDALARRRAGAKIGWFLHAAVYLCVNAGLVLLSLSQGRHWAVYPALGWGLGLLAHGAAVWLLMPGGHLMQRLVARERAQLERGR
ncbi:2TM domain-containing protein [Xenophilus sp. Marseille-Q4582]|uniref:2TM domain-containing protein n=1 Tax=Xenophilus sp. Marseille-Q4582 TaxID=2866600 RepID=UPI001CE4516D|nr:2TM domain-containing protein [Xenophilus sp. Marseille-Q4582]